MRTIAAAHPAAWIFFILLGSYAYFWHSRDWNTSSRLMLTYSLVDRGTVAITDVHRQTGDKAAFQGQYYSDKLPGLSLIGTVPYALAKAILRVPGHPVNQPAFPFWPADYWVTLGTSGLFTAATAALLVVWSIQLGCTPRSACLLGLAYGLATPANVYATLAYGHQTSAFSLFASFYLLWRTSGRKAPYAVFLAGFLAACAAVIELQVGPVSALLGFYLLSQCLRHERRPDALTFFVMGALIPTIVLLGYNQRAFGSSWDLGYFHHDTPRFARVHNEQNPLGMEIPDRIVEKLLALLWGRYRGLAFYAPIVFLTIPGWIALAARRRWDLAMMTIVVVAAVLAVNLFYPEWTGGWSTGPRILVPLLPFAVLPVAALLAMPSRHFRIGTTLLVAALTMAGGVLMLLFQSVDGRVPPEFGDPLVQTVLPIWSGQTPLPGWRFGERFTRNPVSLAAPAAIHRLPPNWQFIQFMPLVLMQAVAIAMLWKFSKEADGSPPTANGARVKTEPVRKTAARAETATAAHT